MGGGFNQEKCNLVWEESALGGEKGKRKKGKGQRMMRVCKEVSFPITNRGKGRGVKGGKVGG